MDLFKYSAMAAQGGAVPHPAVGGLVLPVPDQHLNAEQAERFAHRDLGRLTAPEIEAELARARQGRICAERGLAWLDGRVGACQRELARRCSTPGVE